MFRRLSGSEPGLVGLWNLDDPADPGHDSSPYGRHGKLRGRALTGSEPAFADANRIERGEMPLNLQPCDLVALVTSMIPAYRAKAAAKQQVLQFETGEPSAHALADPSIVAQVLEILVSNAIKYSPPGKRITVGVRGLPDGIRCDVQDEGPGLTAEDQKRLFGKFARLSAKPTGGEQATGLGLSIVKRMVEAMGVRVWCESELGKGATFIVVLPPATVGGHSR